MQAVNLGGGVHVVGVSVVVSQTVDAIGHQASAGRNQGGHMESKKDRLHLEPEAVDIVVLILLLTPFQKAGSFDCFIFPEGISDAQVLV